MKLSADPGLRAVQLFVSWRSTGMTDRTGLSRQTEKLLENAANGLQRRGWRINRRKHFDQAFEVGATFEFGSQAANLGALASGIDEVVHSSLPN
jgi:hypothetical protein